MKDECTYIQIWIPGVYLLLLGVDFGFPFSEHKLPILYRQQGEQLWARQDRISKEVVILHPQIWMILWHNLNYLLKVVAVFLDDRFVSW